MTGRITTGAEKLVQCLEREGVEYIFGLSGGAAIPIFDALVDSKVRIVDTFPENTHAPITYPAATTKGARAEAIAYLNYLASPQVSETWRRFGFLELKK